MVEKDVYVHMAWVVASPLVRWLVCRERTLPQSLSLRAAPGPRPHPGLHCSLHGVPRAKAACHVLYLL